MTQNNNFSRQFLKVLSARIKVLVYLDHYRWPCGSSATPWYYGYIFQIAEDQLYPKLFSDPTSRFIWPKYSILKISIFKKNFKSFYSDIFLLIFSCTSLNFSFCLKNFLKKCNLVKILKNSKPGHFNKYWFILFLRIQKL